jgi:hypothetical protein
MDWIKPDPVKRKSDCEQADNVRNNVKQNAEADGFTVKSTPAGGSDEKNTGLRRHYLGHSEVDGYDIDIPIVIQPEDADDKAFEELLQKFKTYVRKSYPNSGIRLTNSSVELTFSNELRFDIVPMLATDKADEQIILRKDGNKIRTSVQKHNEFIKKRTRLSLEQAGRVSFNDCVRAMKWWREFQADKSYYLFYDEDTGKDNRPPSALIDWLAAHAFDNLGVEKTYAETFAKWFGFLANVVRNKKPVFFADYYTAPSLVGKNGWIVLDPVNADNNIMGKWDNNKLSEFTSWFEEARDSWNRIVRYDQDGDDNLALNELVKLFGNPFKHHCEEK